MSDASAGPADQGASDPTIPLVPDSGYAPAPQFEETLVDPVAEVSPWSSGPGLGSGSNSLEDGSRSAGELTTPMPSAPGPGSSPSTQGPIGSVNPQPATSVPSRAPIVDPPFPPAQNPAPSTGYPMPGTAGPVGSPPSFPPTVSSQPAPSPYPPTINPQPPAPNPYSSAGSSPAPAPAVENRPSPGYPSALAPQPGLYEQPPYAGYPEPSGPADNIGSQPYSIYTPNQQAWPAVVDPMTFSQYGYGQTIPTTHPNAASSMVLGILGVTFCLPLGPIAWYLAVRGRREMAEQPGRWVPSGMLTAGMVLGIIGSAVIALIFFAIMMAIILG